ncbi:MAG: amidohydrolase family protein, partial [Actinomycetota bacterium]
YVAKVQRRGWQSFTHATGDRGIRTVLDAVAHARMENGPADARHQIVHVECVHPDDLPRFGDLGVVACMQPRHCAPDIVGEWRANVGPERERTAWPFRSIASHGGVLAFSSDWNVAEMDPMYWLYTAITRAAPDGSGAWSMDEAVDLDTALRASTRGSAFANRVDDRRGFLAPGADADIAVCSRDLHAIGDPRELLDTHITHTVVAGEVVHRPDG